MDTHAPPGPSITVEPWQEQVIRRLVAVRSTRPGPLSCRVIGAACGRSETWARQACRLLGLRTVRMRRYRGVA